MILQSIIIFIIPWTCRTKVQVNRLDLETWDLWDKHRTRVTISKIMKTLNFNYDEYNSLMKSLEPFNAIYEVTIGGKRFIQVDERVINALEKSKNIRIQLQTENDKIIKQEFNV